MKILMVSTAFLSVAVSAFGYAVEKTSAADGVFTGAVSTPGWRSRTHLPSSAAAGDFRQMSFMDSIAYSGKFNTRPPTGMAIIIR